VFGYNTALLSENIIRLHSMHEMHPILTDVRGVCHSVRLSDCLSCGSAWLRCAKMAEWIKIVFGVNTPGAHGTLY